MVTTMHSDDRGSQNPDPAIGDPKLALIRAAVTNLNYARQYLDKFLHWADYILVTHYRAFASAMSDGKDSRDIAALDFHLVDLWLSVDEANSSPTGVARRRLRAEAIYNRSVLLASPGLSDFQKAEEGYNQVLRVIGQSEETKGLRIAAKFGLVILGAQRALAEDTIAFELSRAKCKTLMDEVTSILEDTKINLQSNLSKDQGKWHALLPKTPVAPATWMPRFGKRESFQELIDQQERDRLVKAIIKCQKDQAIILSICEKLAAVKAALDARGPENRSI